RIERAFHVRRQDREPAIRLHALQEVVDLDVGVAIVAVLHLAALPEERVGLVEEEDGATVLCRVEETAEVLLRLADVLAHDRGEVDAIQIQAQLVRDPLGRHRLARAALAGEEDADAEAPAHLAGETPVLVDPGALPDLVGNVMEEGRRTSRQDEVVPGRLGIEALGKGIQPGARRRAARIPEPGAEESRVMRLGTRDVPDRREVHVELPGENGRAMTGCVPQRLPPSCSLLGGRRAGRVDAEARAAKARPRLATPEEENAVAAGEE